MSTRNKYDPRMKFARTPKGRETAVPRSFSPDEVAEALKQADEDFDNDPIAQRKQVQKERRQSAWQARMAPTRDWNAGPGIEAKNALDAGKITLDEYNQRYRAHLRNFANKDKD